jgi:molybdopterin-biosynthesis enzyme MoeA-like protein
LAGVPSIMQAMLGEVVPKLKIGVRTLSETVRADAREGDIGMQLGEIAKANLGSRSAAIRSSIHSTGLTRMWCCAPAMHRSSRGSNARSRTCWSECGEHNQIALSRHDQGEAVSEIIAGGAV